MRASRLKNLLFQSVAIAVAIGAVPALATHAWDGLHWARVTNLNIRLADNVSSTWDPYLATASSDWTRAEKIDTPVIQGYRNPYYCNPTYGRVEVCNYRYGYTGWLGIAQVWTSYGHIVQGIVALNDTYHSIAPYNSAAWRRFVMCQEVGHTLGLDHQDENKLNANLGSCMDYTRDPTGTLGTNGTLSNEHPNKHDYDQLNLIYAHSDGWQLTSTRTTSTASTATQADQPPQGRPQIPENAGAPPISPSSWGRAVANDAKGRGRVYARNLGGGSELTTFVLWTDPEDASR
jgi:hypothetical protein